MGEEEGKGKAVKKSQTGTAWIGCGLQHTDSPHRKGIYEQRVFERYLMNTMKQRGT